MRAMSRKTLSALFAIAVTAWTIPVDDGFAADRNTPGPRTSARRGLPAGLPHAHYRYRTTIVSGPAVPYDARLYAYGRYGYAPYINSYGIPAAVVVDPVDPAYLWRRPYYGYGYGEVYATPYSCFYYGSC
jgi:hypothetical protein